MSFARVESLLHEIQAHYQALRAIRTRKALEQSALWAEIGGEVRRVLDGRGAGRLGAGAAAGGRTGAGRAGAAGRGLEHPARSAAR